MKKLKNSSKNTTDDKYSFDKYSFLKRELEDLDIKSEYLRLKKSLMLGPRRLNFEALAEAIDFAAENARSAAMLWAAARDLRERYEDGEYAIKWAELVEEATEELEKLKKAKKITGQISETKIKNWIIKNKTKEYNELNDKLKNLQRSERILGILKDQWESRKTLLQSQGKMAEKRNVILTTDDD
ncbi:hypothetical protein [Thermosipho sp. (in: thermotogales)]|jgi:hypothetical protein|uniref:hypothetical protein n=1 Tax=Thermosipho sp. (in: thermotogales) TaxID=1968895 RepID=UPI0025805C29|nr:hypothetical protein [Thermosipho sp. (in: thermotogales)]MBZ4649270.1 hypothetical protein [Thermosipho sp. (in: thermotogales)]